MKIRKLHIFIIFLLAAVCAVAMLFVTRGNAKDAPQSNADTLLSEGQAAFNRNDILTSFNKLNRARSAFEDNGNQQGFFEATVYLSMIYALIGQKEQGYELLKPLSFIDAPNYKAYSSQYYFRTMAYFSAIIDKNYKNAELYTRKCIHFTRQKYPNDTAFVYMDMANLSEMCCMSGDYQRADEIADSLLRAARLKYKLYLSEVYMVKGLVSYHRKEYDKAYDFFEKGLHYSRHYSAFSNEMNILNILVKLDSIASDMPAYMRHKSEFDNVQRKVSGNEIYYKIALMQEQHKIDLIEQENSKSSTIHLLSIGLLSIGIVLLGVVFFSVYRNFKVKQRMTLLERQKLDNLIEMQKMEKELLKLKVEKNNELITKVKKENVAMSLKLANQGVGEDNLTHLEKQLTELDPQFLKKIESRYDNLTHNDLRLICFIKLGMDSHEIASVLNITIGSLHKSRYRLRKKLNLGTNQTLEEFINSIE